VQNGRRRHARLEVHLGNVPKHLWPAIVDWGAHDLMPAVKESLLRCPVPTHLEWVGADDDRPES
jgi:hypothetical protein